jgi:hypothetical protein
LIEVINQKLKIENLFSDIFVFKDCSFLFDQLLRWQLINFKETLDYVCVWLKNSVFTHGQLYVESSRVTSKGIVMKIVVQYNMVIGYQKILFNFHFHSEFIFRIFICQNIQK